MSGREQLSPAVDELFQDAEGVSFQEYKSRLERREVEYVFTQVVGGVPVEHAGVVASRWEGETITSVHGRLLYPFAITNRRTLPFTAAVRRGISRIRRLPGVKSVSRKPLARGALVLLPYGGARRGPRPRLVPALRYAYRTLVAGTLDRGRAAGRASWIAYFDAGTGKILSLEPQYGEVAAFGSGWARDPTTPTHGFLFSVDPAADNNYTLESDDLSPPVFKRVDRLGDGDFDDDEVSLPRSATGVGGFEFANFSTSSIADEPQAVCGSGTNNGFRQVNAFAHLSRMHQFVTSAGSIPTFPEAPVTIRVDAPDPKSDGNYANYDAFGRGQSLLNFVNGAGFESTQCPSAADQPLNGAQDPTTMVHEFAHLITPRLQERRPAGWCGRATCAMPTGTGLFHDFADALGHAYASINCQAAYSRKNNGGADAAHNCVGNHNEGSDLPRLAQTSVPFDPTNPGDHFPEHRAIAAGDYADGQIAAAALWSVRQGLLSKSDFGDVEYLSRLIRALWNFGFAGVGAAGDDRDIYRGVRDLELHMARQWATADARSRTVSERSHSTNKVVAGFARAGIFMIPSNCIDGSASTNSWWHCADDDAGGDAIVDVDDNEPANDAVINDVSHPRHDSLRHDGPVPTFQVWTGPPFKFDSAGRASNFKPSASNPAACHTQYQVEVSRDPAFGFSITSTDTRQPWQTVSNTSATRCFASWTPTRFQWDMVKGSSEQKTRLYYRVRTRDSTGDARGELISTRPNNGFWGTVPAPFVVVSPVARDRGR